MIRLNDLIRVASGEAYQDSREPGLTIGDIVMLNSGGPRMMIVDILDDGRVVAAWRDGDAVVEHSFPRLGVHRVSPL
jgi:uncharacterized protein YodC (DUF2158 family)